VRRRSLAIVVITTVVLLHGGRLSAAWRLSDMLGRDSKGRTVYRPKPMPERFRNPYSAENEAAFQKRARYVIGEQSKQRVNAGNTYFENEKRTYGYLMAHVLGGNAEQALRGLQGEDAQATSWHKHTKGIDFYACFTLKHQTRKYFYFGDLLEPDYRQRMFEGAKLWTKRDPLRRRHHAYEPGKQGWGPDAKNSWVDVRSTENLFLMRVTSVYLFAEETGNKQTAAKYKNIIRNYTKALYRVGMGEWDSENYHGHSIGPLCNLYDFAQDEEVRLLAKAGLDWLFAAGAVKYFRGGFNGPTKRDYNHTQPFGGSAANMLWLHFGDCPVKNTHWESDEVHLITTAYRPPPAVMNLARKTLREPVEMFASKPHYSATTANDLKSPPESLETQYIGNTFQLGSLAGGTRPGKSDVNGFKVVLSSSRRGCNAVQCVPGPDPKFPGSPQYQTGKVSASNRVAQYENLAVWLVEDGRSPWLWVMPKDIGVSQKNGVTFFRGEKTWLAIHPLRLNIDGVHSRLTESIRWKDTSRKKRELWPDHHVVSAKGTGGSYCGFAVEIGEPASHGSFERFQSAVIGKSKVDASQLKDGLIEFRASDGKTLRMQYAKKLSDFAVWRDGSRHDWKQHAAFAYQSADGKTTGPIHQQWNDGTLTVSAGGKTFTCTVDDDGKVKFTNR